MSFRDVVTKVLVFQALCLIFVCLRFAQGTTNARVEVNWGDVVYSSPVEFYEAKRLADFLAAEGMFRGEHKSLRLVRKGDILTMQMVFAPGAMDPSAAEGILRDAAKIICTHVFPGKKVAVELTDSEFNVVKQLLPPTLF